MLKGVKRQEDSNPGQRSHKQLLIHQAISGRKLNCGMSYSTNTYLGNFFSTDSVNRDTTKRWRIIKSNVVKWYMTLPTNIETLVRSLFSAALIYANDALRGNRTLTVRTGIPILYHWANGRWITPNFRVAFNGLIHEPNGKTQSVVMTGRSQIPHDVWICLSALTITQRTYEV